MSRKRLTALLATLITFGTSLLLAWVAFTPFGYRAESLLLDSWFALRYRLFGPDPLDDRLVLVGVDSQTLDRVGKPNVLWQGEMALLLEKILSQGAAAVGLDFVISPMTHGLEADDPIVLRIQDQALALGLVAATYDKLILAELYGEDEVGSVTYDHIVSPDEVVTALLSAGENFAQRLGFINVPVDPDGTIRRLKVFLEQPSPESEDWEPDNFALRIVEAATSEKILYLPGSHRSSYLSWQNRTIELFYGDSFLIDFPGPTESNTKPGEAPLPTRTFSIISALDVLEDRLPEQFFKDKIVVVGPTASSFNDSKTVPGDHTYHGAAVHLSVINMFLQDRFLVRPAWFWWVFIVVCALFGLGMGRLGRRHLFPLTLISILLVSFLAFALAGWWIPGLTAIAAFSLGGINGYLERLVTIERDRAKVRATFSRMVSPQVMDHVLRNPRDLRHGVRKEITVLFVDINDFTPTCERHEPEEIIEMLSVYFSLMVEAILKYDGYIKQYVGDEIMVIYGAPDDGQDHATRALLTALEMRSTLADAKVKSAGQPGFYDVKIGINSGSVVVGKVGPEQRWEYAAVGDSVNLGARIMSTAQKLGTDIGVSARTRERFQKECEAAGIPPESLGIAWTSFGIHAFKGKVAELEVFGIHRCEPEISTNGNQNRTARKGPEASTLLSNT